MINIKQGDAYSIPVSAKLNGSPLNLAEVAKIEFTLGDGDGTIYARKLYPGEVTVDEIEGGLWLMLPLTQEETFAMPADGAVAFDMRVYFNGGDVKGAKSMQYIPVLDALSEEVL